jgi:hypothetical protein
MNKVVVLERDGKRQAAVIRQCPHDPPAIVGRPLRYGGGKKWTVVEVRDAN